MGICPILWMLYLFPPLSPQRWSQKTGAPTPAPLGTTPPRRLLQGFGVASSAAHPAGWARWCLPLHPPRRAPPVVVYCFCVFSPMFLLLLFPYDPRAPRNRPAGNSRSCVPKRAGEPVSDWKSGIFCGVFGEPFLRRIPEGRFAGCERMVRALRLVRGCWRRGGYPFRCGCGVCRESTHRIRAYGSAAGFHSRSASTAPWVYSSGGTFVAVSGAQAAGIPSAGISCTTRMRGRSRCPGAPAAGTPRSDQHCPYY